MEMIFMITQQDVTKPKENYNLKLDIDCVVCEAMYVVFQSTLPSIVCRRCKPVSWICLNRLLGANIPTTWHF